MDCDDVLLGPHTVRRVVHDSEREAVVCFFMATAHTAGWSPGDQLGAYDDCSEYFAAYRDGILVGGCQLVLARIAQMLPCHTVWPELPVRYSRDVGDMALVAVEPTSRGSGQALWALLFSLWRYCMAEGIVELWAEVPCRNLTLYNRMGLPWRARGEARRHWGELCFPVTATIGDMAREVARRAGKSDFFRELLEAGLRAEPVRLPLLLRGDVE